jgi:hypothetical protein
VVFAPLSRFSKFRAFTDLSRSDVTSSDVANIA